MKYAGPFMLALALLLAGCDQSPPPDQQAQGPTCPGTDFAGFLNAYSESETLQKTLTIFPLEVRELEVQAASEPALVTTMMNSSQLSYPLIPPEAERKAQSLIMRIEDYSAKQVKVQLYKDNADYQVFYYFNRTPDLCWCLVRVEDNSL